jgi:hypothetical protein
MRSISSGHLLRDFRFLAGMGPAKVNQSPQQEEGGQHRQVAVGPLALGAVAFDRGVSNRIGVRVDEIKAALCRTGRWWGFEHYDVVPDRVALSKPMRRPPDVPLLRT